MPLDVCLCSCRGGSFISPGKVARYSKTVAGKKKIKALDSLKNKKKGSDK